MAATESEVPPPTEDDRPRLSFMGSDFPIISAPGGEFQINSKSHNRLLIGEVTETSRHVMSCRPFLCTLSDYIARATDKELFLTNPNQRRTVRRYPKALIQGIIVAFSSLLEKGLIPDIIDPNNCLIFPERFVPHSYHFMKDSKDNPFFNALRNQAQYKPHVEVCFRNSRRHDGFYSQHIRGLRELIFTQILKNDPIVLPEWIALDSSLKVLYEKSFVNLPTEEDWKCCEAHAVFMSWEDHKDLIENLYNWRFHSNDAFLKTLVYDALTTIPELSGYLNDWIKTIRAKGGPLLNILNFRHPKKAYKTKDVDDFVMFLRNSSVHLCDKDLSTGDYKNIDMTRKTEKPYAQDGYVYLVLARLFPNLFLKLNEFLILKKAPPQ